MAIESVVMPASVFRFRSGMRYHAVVQSVHRIPNHRLVAGLFAITASLWFAGRAIAEPTPPFYGGPVTAFDVEVAVIDSGTLLDAQAVVSCDQRYVTINARADNSSLLALQQFRTQNASTAGAGFVGGVDPSGETKAKAAPTLPSEIDRTGRDAVSVLNRRGVFLLMRLK